MAEKCGKCVKVLTESDVVVKCSECKLSFHAACTRAGSSQNFIKTRNKPLKCDSCANVTKPNTSASESEDKMSILDAIRELKTDFSKNLEEKINTVLNSVSALQLELKSLQVVAATLQGEQEKLSDRCSSLEHANKKLTDEVLALQLQLQDAEQHSRSANIEIDGLPVTQGESVYSCLQQVAEVIGVPFKSEDISIAHRLRSFSKRHNHPPIIAQFVSRRTKETWLTAAREKKILNATEIHHSLPPSRVYINNHLTSNNKMLLGKARRLKKEGKIVLAGFFNGKVIVKAAAGADSIRVTTLQDLERYEGKNRQDNA